WHAGSMAEHSTAADPDPGVPVALVTGAARGIGAATVAALVADGWSVVATDRCADEPTLDYPLGSRAQLDAVVEAANAARPASAVALEADVRDRSALDAAARFAVERFGRLDAAIAAAGVVAGNERGWEL